MRAEKMSDASSNAPPAPAPVVAPAPAPAGPPSGPRHPLWEKAAGRGQKPAAQPQGRFAPISLAALEQRSRIELDGASSAGGCTEIQERPTEKTPRKRHAPELEAEDSEEEGDDVACAAFGIGRKKHAAASIAGSEASAGPAMNFNVGCVGCNLPGKIEVVEAFVRAAAPKMAETALFKAAALVYQEKVVEPARDEGVRVPSWSWKAIRSHFTLHCMSDGRFQRLENLRVLAGMRKTLEMSLLREDEEGQYNLDKSNSEQILKIIALQSKEIGLLNEKPATVTVQKK